MTEDAEHEDRKSTLEEKRRDPETRLPHDRDEAAREETQDAQHHENRQVIRQAKADVDAGIVDTERIGEPTVVPPSR